jgi:Cu+-exporting ATPase
LEIAHAIRVVAFDKTGTLTEGKPAVVALKGITSSDDRILQLAQAVQQQGDHPLAKAVNQRASAKGVMPLPASNAKALPGRGVQADVDGLTVWLGNARLMQELSVNTAQGASFAAEQESAGRSVSWLAVRDESGIRIAGLLSFGDTVKSNARHAIAKLDVLGIRSIGIEEFRAQVLPDDKAARVTELKNRYGTVAMVGDGINDAPALAAADIGIAMASGTDIAMHTAGITLMRADPALVADAVGISRRTYAKIRQNLFWAFIYNVIGIPMAAFGLLNPVIAGAAMAFSSVSVVSNALLLKRWRP